MIRRCTAGVACTAAIAMWAASVSAAPPEVVIFGGGWGPEGTQQSIEAQVIALTDALRARSPTVLFAGGHPKSRSVQVQAPIDENTDLLGLVFSQRRDLHTAYRETKVRAAGAATRDGVFAALRATARAPSGTIVFGVGHGSPADHDQAATIELWGPDDRVSAVDLAQLLDGARGGPTAFVLGHCHSGAFTDLTHRGGRIDQPIADPPRCVFAAVPADREAAGCTADLTADDAEAYISRVTEAFEKPTAADFDRNGKVTLAEAHAYAKIHDDTIDVPVSTRDAWVDLELGDRAPDPKALEVSALLGDASAADVAVIRALGARYVAHEDGVARAQRDLRRLEDDITEQRKEFDGKHDRFEALRQVILDRLLLRWPELSNPYHVVSRALLAGPAPAVVSWIRAQGDLPKLETLDRELQAVENQILEGEKAAARLERWLRTVQAVASERAIRKNGRAAEGLAAIRQCETLSP